MVRKLIVISLIRIPPEHEMSLSEELIELQRKQKQLLDRINHMISGPKQVSLRDQMCFITRGVEVFSMIADAMDGCFSKEIQYKMPYYLIQICASVF